MTAVISQFYLASARRAARRGKEGLGAGRGGTHVIPLLEVINQ